MHVVAVIQARMGSTRLPGKVMLPLAGEFVLERVVERVDRAETVDTVVVATSEEECDDIVARFAPRFGAEVVRGSESDVLQRLFEAASAFDANIVVRITADCPLIPSACIDEAVSRLREQGAAYASNTLERTFPRGFDAEAFTMASFEQVVSEATEPHHREHVTPYYHEHPDEFDLATVTSEAVFAAESARDRTDLRLTLDEAADYELLREVYRGVAYEGGIDAADVIMYVDENRLRDVNSQVEQKEIEDGDRDQG